MPDETFKETPLKAEHEALGARMMAFAGWRMPVEYEGILREHLATRSACGVFDVSHMGQLSVRGEPAANWLDRQLTNEVAKLRPGDGHYTLMLNDAGGVLDDLILYRLEDDRFLLIVNASAVEADEQWLSDRLESGVSLSNVSEGYGGLAIQGPDTVAVAERIWRDGPALPRWNQVIEVAMDHGKAFVGRTGYTGEDGFEIFLPKADARDFWRRLVEIGVRPCGLGARDTLRLEMGYPLNGSDLRPDRTPLEAGLGRFVALEKEEFTGREALLEQKAGGLKERLTGLVMGVKGPPLRAGYEVYEGSSRVGVLTSGCFSPSLGVGLGMGYLPCRQAEPGLELEVLVRNKRFLVTTAKKPFYRPSP